MDKPTNNSKTTKLGFSIKESDYEPLKKMFKWASKQDAINEVFIVLEWVQDEIRKGRIIISDNSEGTEAGRLVTKAITYLSESGNIEKMDKPKSSPSQGTSFIEEARSDYLYGLMLNFGFANKYEIFEEGFTLLKWIKTEIENGRIVGSCDKNNYRGFQECPLAIKAAETKDHFNQAREEATQFIVNLML